MNNIHLNIREYLEGHWKCLVAGVAGTFAVVAIIFALPLVTVSTEATETEYTTEFRQETYAVNEPYVTREVSERSRVIASGFYTVVPSGVWIPFYVDKPDARLIGQFENTIAGSFIVFSDASHIVWEMRGSRGMIDLPLPSGLYQARFREDVMWGEDCYIHLALKWTEVEQVTRYRPVINYRQVPVQVEKYRTTVKEERISVWKYLFGK